MALPDKRGEAEKLYAEDGLSRATIAEKLGVSEGTVYRWKAEAAEGGEARDWEARRRVSNLAPSAMLAMYANAVKNLVIEIDRNPKLLLDPKVADAMAKHISVLKRLDPRGQYKSVALDLLDVINRWLAEHQPELKAKLDPYWDSIFEALVKYAADKGLF